MKNYLFFSVPPFIIMRTNNCLSPNAIQLRFKVNLSVPNLPAKNSGNTTVALFRYCTSILLYVA